MAIIIVSNLISSSPQATLRIMGILFASSYLLFYSGDLAVFWYTLQAEKAIRNNNPVIVKEMYRMINRISPGSISGKTALAIVHTLEGEWDRAEKLYREVLRVRPYDTRLQYNLAITLVKKGEYDESLRSLLLIVRLYPGWVVAYSAVGEVYMALNNYELAYKYFKLALFLDSNDQSALQHLPIIAKKLEQAA